MRGADAASTNALFLARITPAYAGSRDLLPAHGLTFQDHPRVCGEQQAEIADKLGITGSPPRMRGAVIRSLQTSFLAGITPAYAGSRRSHPTANMIKRDHPRVCGEQGTESLYKISDIGSPPRMRGAEGGSTMKRTYTGITPAYAGSRPQNNQRRYFG